MNKSDGTLSLSMGLTTLKASSHVILGLHAHRDGVTWVVAPVTCAAEEPQRPG